MKLKTQLICIFLTSKAVFMRSIAQSLNLKKDLTMSTSEICIFLWKYFKHKSSPVKVHLKTISLVIRSVFLVFLITDSLKWRDFLQNIFVNKGGNVMWATENFFYVNKRKNCFRNFSLFTFFFLIDVCMLGGPKHNLNIFLKNFVCLSLFM